MIPIVLGIAVVVAASFVIRRYLPWIIRYCAVVRALNDVGCEDPHGLLGHIRASSTTATYFSMLTARTKKFPKCVKRWHGPFLYLSCYHPDLVKILLATEEPKDNVMYRFLRPWIGDGLVTSSGRKWKRNRRLLTPAFHFGVLKKYHDCTNEVANEMLDKWSRSGEQTIRVEMFHDVSFMSLDNILQCILSKKSGCQRGENSEYLNAIKLITKVTAERLFNPMYQLDFVFKMTETGRKYFKALEVAHRFAEDAVLERKARLKAMDEDTTIVLDLDFLNILLMAKDENDVGLTHQEICDEVDTFVFGGHDTVSSAISWAFYNLAKYSEFQEKCRNEVKEVIENSKAVKWTDLSKFPFLTTFIKESLRLYPPIVSIARRMTKPTFFPRGFGSDQYNVDSAEAIPPDASRTLPRDAYVGTNIFALHRNEYIWENPNVFNPDRFLPENTSKRSPHAYAPFSSGPRNCIGQNFAMNQIKVVLALALSRYRFNLDDSYPEPELEYSIILRSKTGIHIKVEKLD